MSVALKININLTTKYIAPAKKLTIATIKLN